MESIPAILHIDCTGGNGDRFAWFYHNFFGYTVYTFWSWFDFDPCWFVHGAVVSLDWELMASATYLFAIFIPKHFTFVTTAQPVHKMDAGPDFTVIVIACDDAVQLAVFIGLDAFQLAVRIEKFASAV